MLIMCRLVSLGLVVFVVVEVLLMLICWFVCSLVVVVVVCDISILFVVEG